MFTIEHRLVSTSSISNHLVCTRPPLYSLTLPSLPFHLSPPLLSQILECVTVNLTLLYALLAYSSLKQRDFRGVYVSPSCFSLEFTYQKAKLF